MPPATHTLFASPHTSRRHLETRIRLAEARMDHAETRTLRRELNREIRRGQAMRRLVIGYQYTATTTVALAVCLVVLGALGLSPLVSVAQAVEHVAR